MPTGPMLRSKPIIAPEGYPLRRGSVVVARVKDDESIATQVFVLRGAPKDTVEAMSLATYETCELPLEETIAEVFLCTNETDLGTDQDVLYRRGESDSTLPYDLLVHKGMPTGILRCDIWRVIGWIDLDAPKEPAGIPVVSRSDGRWVFQEQQLDGLLPYQARGGRAFGDI